MEKQLKEYIEYLYGEEKWFYEEGGGVVDEGNGWHIIQWMEIPQ